MAAAERDMQDRFQISLQRGGKFREGIGNGLVSDYPGHDHKPKTRKGNQIMKNQNIQFKRTAGVLVPLLFAFVAVLVAATPAVARDERFNGIVSGHNLSQSCANCCDPTILVFNSGGANELGTFTGTAQFFPRPCAPNPNLCENNIPYTGTFDWFSADGDEIYGTFDGYACPTETPGVYENHETAEVTGGTGRFAHATGHFDLTGQLDFTTSPPSFYAPWQGTIRLRGH